MADTARVGTGVGVILLKDGKILLGRRIKGLGAGSWSLPGGKIEYGETFEDAAKRETLEETGVIVRSARVISVNNDIFEEVHYVTVGLVAESFVGGPQALEPEKMVDWGWFAPEALPNPIFPPSRNILDCFLGNMVNKR